MKLIMQQMSQPYESINIWTQDFVDQANISTSYVRVIGHELKLGLRDLPELIKFTNLEIKDILQDDNLLTTRQILQIFQNSLALADSPDLGLRYGKRLTPTTHGAIGFLVNSSVNLNIALKAVQHFLPTRMAFAHLDLEYTQTHVICTLDFSAKLPATIYRFISETFIVIFFECAEFIIGQPIKDAKICFAHDEPEYGDLYQNYFHCQVSFSHSVLKIEIPLHVCEIPNASADQQSFLLAKQQCERMLDSIKPTHKTYSYEIQKKMLNTQLSELSEDYIASTLFITKRTLARHLASEGTSFREIRDKILSQQASYYLLETELTIESIAQLLNYHDSSNFRRAFKRWYNITPQEYRLTRKI